MSQGQSAPQLKHGLRSAISEGRLPRDRVPEELREVLFKELDSEQA